MWGGGIGKEKRSEVGFPFLPWLAGGDILLQAPPEEEEEERKVFPMDVAAEGGGTASKQR